ncbi:hypothetical protein [Cellulomonas sp. Marseille-Q8402]
MNATPTTTGARRKPLRLVAVGLAATTLCVAGAGFAAAANPETRFARAVEGAVQAVGIDWSAMPENYTQAQYETFWGAGYGAQDVEELNELWGTSDTETKARAGQLLIDGQPVPVAPSGPEDTSVAAITAEQSDAFFGAGYTGEDVEELSALWSTEFLETKARAGQLLLDGEQLPIEPSGTPVEVAGS